MFVAISTNHPLKLKYINLTLCIIVPAISGVEEAVGRGLMVRIHDSRATSRGFESRKKSMVVAGSASDLNSLLSSDKFSL